jgi:gamma-D-glutamyl-L-lysine dipeptidyl-peptidase
LNHCSVKEQFMKKFVYQFLILAFVSSSAFTQTPNHKIRVKNAHDVGPYIEALGKIEEKIAPDRRIAVFDVEVYQLGKKIVLKGEVGSSETKTAVLDAVKNAGSSEIIDSISILPEPACSDKPFAFVRVSVAPLREKPSESAEMVTQALMGSVLKVLKLKGSWMYVQMEEDNYLGWVDNGQCIRQTQEQMDQWMNGHLIMTTAYFDLVRMQPSDSAQPVCDVITGALLEGKEYNQGWFAVSLPDGRTGYLPKKSGMEYEQWKSSRNPTEENIEKTAKIYLGVPYLWGGTSPKGFDCSGFTKTVYKLNGINLQRDADQQGMAGVNVPLENEMAKLQKGDLLFFGRKPVSGKSERITHVGIYLGQKEFIHCSGMVKMNSFDPSSPMFSEYHLKILVKVKRYLPEK